MQIRAEVEMRLAGHLLYSQDDKSDPLVHCKLFHAYGAGTWYVTEYDGKDTAFGYVTGLKQRIEMCLLDIHRDAKAVLQPSIHNTEFHHLR